MSFTAGPFTVGPFQAGPFCTGPLDMYGVLWDFAGSQPPTAAYGFRRTGLGTLIDASGNVVYGDHNLLTHSEQLDNAAWPFNNVLAFGAGSTANAAVSPSGETTADFVCPSTAASPYHTIRQDNVTVNQIQTFSVYAKAAGYSYIQLLNANASRTVCYDLTNGSISTLPAGVTSATCDDVGGGWYRCTYTAQAEVWTYALVNVSDTFVATGGSAPASWTPNGTSGIYLWGAQLNAGYTALTYVPTTTAAVYLPRYTFNPTTHAALGLLIEPQVTQLLNNGGLDGAMATQTVTVAAVANTLSFTGTGTVTLSGVSTAGPLVGTGTGEANRVSLTFTPTAGSLTLTVSGTCTNAQLEAGSVATSVIPQSTAGTLVRTTDGNWDITGSDFTTLWGAANVGSPGAEIIVNGDFASGASWTPTAGWGIAAGVAFATGAAGFLFQSAGLSPLRWYQIEFDVVSVTAGSVTGLINGTVDAVGPAFTTTGRKSFALQADATTNGYFSISGTSFTGSIDNVSVRPILTERTIVVEWYDTGTTTGDFREIFVARSGASYADSVALVKWTDASIRLVLHQGLTQVYLSSAITCAVGSFESPARNKAAISLRGSGTSISVNGAAEVSTAQIPGVSDSARIAGASTGWGVYRDILKSLSSRPTALTGAALQALSAL